MTMMEMTTAMEMMMVATAAVVKTTINNDGMERGQWRPQ